MKNVITEDILNKIKRIKFFTKRLMRSSLVGDYLSAFKGTGLEFDQIRDYQVGDDIRFIDWNSSAKMNKMMVKQLIEERDRTVILMIDVSASSNYSSQQELRKDMIAQVAASLAFIAGENKDRVGALFFSDRVEKWIAPSRGIVHVGKIIESVFSIQPQSSKTDIAEALRFLVGLKKRNAVVFMLSDWIDEVSNYDKILKVASCEHDFVGIRFLDDCEGYFPDTGLLEVQDPETLESFFIDSRQKKIQDKLNLNYALQLRLKEQKKLFEKYRIDLLNLNVGRSFVNPMVNFFRQRIKRQI